MFDWKQYKQSVYYLNVVLNTLHMIHYSEMNTYLWLCLYLIHLGIKE